MVLDMSADSEDTIRRLAKRRQDALKTVDERTNDLKTAVIDAVRNGMSENHAKDLAGVTRMTIRAWLGKK